MDSPPKVLFWYRLYALTAVVAGILFIVYGARLGIDASADALSKMLRGPTYATVGVFFSVFGAVSLLPGRQPWKYAVGRVLIIAGLTGLVTLPFAAILLRSWLQAPVKRWFEVPEASG